ncbi:hypothetical protein [Streptomyces sp. NPDC088146]|uniref:hypothetical protein n=1 Tax=Streptomyces sp. NPDC088146 TaxID=3365829 RepID=UPI00381D91DD
MQQITEDRRRASRIGRTAELDVFRGNFGLSPEGDRHRFLFPVRGNAGAGKTSLVRERERVAQECGALTACADESADSVPARWPDYCPGGRTTAGSWSAGPTSGASSATARGYWPTWTGRWRPTRRTRGRGRSGTG